MPCLSSLHRPPARRTLAAACALTALTFAGATRVHAQSPAATPPDSATVPASAPAPAPAPVSSPVPCRAPSAVVKLADYAAPDGHIVVLRFATGCRTGAPTSGRADSAAAHAAADTLAHSPLVEAALAARHAGAAAQATAQAAKPSRREAFVALLTAVAVLLLK